ncbi:General stress protein A [termite gut metagenome]|uniref:General stress protein A n=1 Tax=termite gut metagenome TaxID=433724 RepID=A0A5J4SF44_9ZZZZ
MDIVCGIDNNYVQHCGVLMASVFENDKEEEITFHILTDGLTQKNQVLLEQVASSYKQQIQIYHINKSIFQDCPIRKGDHVSLAAYFRILIPSVLPNSLHKILYLDCDIIVRKNIKELWDYNILDKPMGAVYDMCAENIRTYNRLCYNRELGYFNSGVLLINLDYWRNNNISNKLLRYINQYPERIELWDQDALNGVLIKGIVRLPLKYNMQDDFYRRKSMLKSEFLEEIKDDLKDPVILHFTGSCKPWFKEGFHPLKDEYLKYLILTPWKKYKRTFPPTADFKYILKYYLLKLGLLNNIYRRTRWRN